jgi:hypothetical protein
MGQVRIDIEGDAVEGYPAAQAHADGGDLVLAAGAAIDPDTDPPVAGAGLNTELGSRTDQPALQRLDEGAHIAAAPRQVQHDIGHALARPVIGVFAAAARLIDGKAVRHQQVFAPGTGAGRVERRVLEQPDQLAGRAVGNRRRPRFHEGQRLRVGHLALGDGPFDRRYCLIHLS